jgi:hypothetical protein
MNTCDATTAMVATMASTHQQRSVAMAAMPPPGVGPEAKLEAVCQLFHNPPCLHASLSAVEQWLHDID